MTRKETDQRKAGTPARQAERRALGLRSRRILRGNMLDLSKLRERARARGLPFAITLADLPIPEMCPILGLRLSFSSNGNSPNAPSVDRIDSRIGYVRGNVQVVSFRANTLKRDAELEELVALGRWAENF